MIKGRLAWTSSSSPISRDLLKRLFPPWTEKALCIDQWDLFDSDLESIMGVDDIPVGMSPQLAEGIRERDRRNALAVEICWKCPVRQECLRDALEQGREETVRGGYTPAERLIISEGYTTGDWSQF